MVEAAGQIAADLDVLHLVLADRHDVGVVGQNVGGHQHRIGEQPGVGRQPLGLLLLVGVASFQQPQRRAGHQQPAQLGDLRHVRLHEQRGPLRVEAQGQQIECRVECRLPQPLRIADRGQRVQVGDEVIGLVLVLQGNVLANRAKVVAPVKTPRRLNSRKNTHGSSKSFAQGQSSVRNDPLVASELPIRQSSVPRNVRRFRPVHSTSRHPSRPTPTSQ